MPGAEDRLAGRVVGLALRPPGSAAPVASTHVLACAGTGLVGDRHADARSPRQVLLAASAAYGELGLAPLALRENILVDVDVARLPSGSLLRIGAHAILRLSFQCEACGALERQRLGLARALGTRRGMLASVATGGEIRLGDPVRILAQRLPALAEDWRTRVLQVLAAVPEGMVVDYALLARLAGIQSSYCRAFPRLLGRPWPRRQGAAGANAAPCSEGRDSAAALGWRRLARCAARRLGAGRLNPGSSLIRRAC
ncbi:MOSC domain-containing protein [Massilia sp. MS-15]|uniref:MOSC domain-containing protein n=1 Tax=Massilia sp. MS-15 TaxID=2878200 RepID=UPI001CD341C0|nr:MOSC domain-containing protein [Massilia sp. MS-15]MCA1246505.1 hypothetical protein [Massilia sp. MS-15]